MGEGIFMSNPVVIVEPDAEDREKLKVLYESSTLKVDVEVFPDAVSALLAIHNGLKPCLVVTSHEPADPLNPMTGADLCRGLQGLYGPNAAPPTIVTVNESSPLMPAYQAGATDVLLKPFNDNSLLSKSHMSIEYRKKKGPQISAPRQLTASAFKIACHMRSMTDEGGWVFGSKLVVQELGRGGIGVVVKAMSVVDGEITAIKLLQPEHVHDEEWFSRFRREGSVLMGINHDNLVMNKAIGVDSGINYIEMDFVVGTPLNELIESVGNVPEEKAFNWIAQIARGLQALSDNNVIHRDIKPENIMITKSGHAWLIDFGLSKRKGDVQLTQEGEILGTIAFIAPETISGAEPDIVSDIYALGVTLYEMLTGEDLLASKTTREIFLDTLRGKTVDNAESHLSPRAAEIIKKMMAVSREDRYPTPNTLLEDIKKHYPEAYAGNK
jgi:CheY-like chemotaxis protein